MSNVRSKYLPALSAQDKARWAYQLSVSADKHRQTVTDEGKRVVWYCPACKHFDVAQGRARLL
jgi:hypothetical protein